MTLSIPHVWHPLHYLDDLPVGWGCGANPHEFYAHVTETPDGERPPEGICCRVRIEIEEER